MGISMKTLLIPILLISASLLFINVDAEPVDQSTDNLITLFHDKNEIYQYEEISLAVVLDKNLSLEDVVIVSNIQGMVKGIPSLDDQIPYGELDIESAMDRENSSIVISLRVTDQMIWFDGERMLDNITITVVFLCIYDQFQDLESTGITLFDMNDPPEFSGPVEVKPDEIRAGDIVTFSVEGATDRDSDEVEISWSFNEEVIGRGRSIDTSFESPGTHTVLVTAFDGNETVEMSHTIDVLPRLEPEPPTPDNETLVGTPENEKEKGPPWLLVPILILFIAITAILGVIVRTKDEKESEPPRRYLWSMSPMRGPSEYQKELLARRLKDLQSRPSNIHDEEELLDKDIERWNSGWTLDILF
jgi:hypothetical protein